MWDRIPIGKIIGQNPRKETEEKFHYNILCRKEILEIEEEFQSFITSTIQMLSCPVGLNKATSTQKA